MIKKFLFNSESRTPQSTRGERGILLILIFYSAFSLFSVRPCLSAEALCEGRKALEGHFKNSFSIMIDPGESTHRLIEGTPERNITLAMAHALQNQIEQLIPSAQVILTRTGNETVRPLAHANFANRLDVDLFLSLHCFAETQTRPQVAIYTFAYGDQNPMQLSDLAFYTYDQAHLRAQRTTQNYAQLAKQVLAEHAKQFDLVGWYQIPFKPLIGVKAPAIGIEIGLKNKHDWQTFIGPLAESVLKIMEARA